MKWRNEQKAMLSETLHITMPHRKRLTLRPSIEDLRCYFSMPNNYTVNTALQKGKTTIAYTFCLTVEILVMSTTNPYGLCKKSHCYKILVKTLKMAAPHLGCFWTHNTGWKNTVLEYARGKPHNDALSILQCHFKRCQTVLPSQFNYKFK